jgi:hypothetical protein
VHGNLSSAHYKIRDCARIYRRCNRRQKAEKEKSRKESPIGNSKFFVILHSNRFFSRGAHAALQSSHETGMKASSGAPLMIRNFLIIRRLAVLRKHLHPLTKRSCLDSSPLAPMQEQVANRTSKDMTAPDCPPAQQQDEPGPSKGHDEQSTASLAQAKAARGNPSAAAPEYITEADRAYNDVEEGVRMAIQRKAL